MISQQPNYPRQLMARIIFAWLFIVLAYFFFNNSLLSQLKAPVLLKPGIDNGFWLLHILHIPQFILQQPAVAILFDLLLTVSCIICIAVPQQRFFTIITVVAIWIFYVCYSSAAGKQYAQIGYLLAPIPFLALQQNKFNFCWEGFRYWVCFLYLSAGFYKIYFGGFAADNTMSQILMEMNAEWFVFNQHSFQANCIDWLIQHQHFSQWLYRIAVLIDISVIIGFFTKRYDKWLMIGLISFHVGNYFLLHISFVEQSLIFAPFFPWQRFGKFIKTKNSNDRPLQL